MYYFVRNFHENNLWNLKCEDRVHLSTILSSNLTNVFLLKLVFGAYTENCVMCTIHRYWFGMSLTLHEVISNFVDLKKKVAPHKKILVDDIQCRSHSF
jgi:hypothetical protein